jgi:hypothetical protein
VALTGSHGLLQSWQFWAIWLQRISSWVLKELPMLVMITYMKIAIPIVYVKKSDEYLVGVKKVE